MTTTTRIKNIWLKYQKETGKQLDRVVRNAYYRHDDNDHIEYVEWLEDQLEKQLNL